MPLFLSRGDSPVDGSDNWHWQCAHGEEAAVKLPHHLCVVQGGRLGAVDEEPQVTAG